jgi:CRISPR-associated endonuclease/helicase Cas3
LDPDARRAAFSPDPTFVPVSDILFDAWSLSSITGQLPGRPPVEPYLHGLSEHEPPETRVAWREEVEILDAELRDIYEPEDLLERYPLKPHELLRDRSDRVFKQIAELAKRKPNLRVWLLDNSGAVNDKLTLRDLADAKTKDRINHRTILLPPIAGGLRGGLLDGTAETADDVADVWPDPNDQPRRVRLWDDDPQSSAKTKGMRLILEIDTRPAAEEDTDSKGEPLTRRFWRWYEKPRTADTEGSASGASAVALAVHTQDVEANLKRFVTKLALPLGIAQAVQLAGAYHDLGKKRELWQRSIGNFGSELWAKSGTGRRPRGFGDGYRHEFGSLLDALDEQEFQRLSEDTRDIVLHLIASHHGRGRPHFPLDEMFDPQRSRLNVSTVATEVPRRFARLQRRYGRWGLAFLESLLRAADYEASAKPSQIIEDA